MSSIHVSGFKCTPTNVGWKCLFYPQERGLKPYPTAEAENLVFNDMEIRATVMHTIESNAEGSCMITADTLSCESDRVDDAYRRGFDEGMQEARESED